MSTEYKFNNPGEHYFVIYSFVDWLMYDKAQVSRMLLVKAKDLRQFVHGYRETLENTYNDTREIMVNVDTSLTKFKKHYQIIDSKEKIILVAPRDAKVN